LRSLSITEILSVPVPTRPAMAVDRCATHYYDAPVHFSRPDQSLVTRCGGAIATPALSHSAIFIGNLSPAR
ncbi:MAG TPA: hypothetical protein VHS97_05570, partial [Isosphaeraceae bacterium]|nr:hypothetical protein [Isosphaeraceae bacterium]